MDQSTVIATLDEGSEEAVAAAAPQEQAPLEAEGGPLSGGEEATNDNNHVDEPKPQEVIQESKHQVQESRADESRADAATLQIPLEEEDEEESQPQHQAQSLDLFEQEDGQAVYDEAHELSLIREFGGHPLMQRVQDALLGQLQQTYDRLKGELRVKEEDLKRTKDKRETVGVELYGQQQQLARLQLTLESFQNSFGNCVQERAAIEVSKQA